MKFEETYALINRKILGTKIGIDMGHCLTGADYGAVGLIDEVKENRKVGKELIRILRAMGMVVVDCTCNYANSVNESLNYRTRTANLNNVDIFISIHFNAGGGIGIEIFTYRGEHTKTATKIKQQLTTLGFRDRGIKNGTGFAVINGTKMEASLLEICFVDSRTDVDLYKKVGPAKVAESIAYGILGDYIKKRENEPIPAPAPKPTDIEYPKDENHWGYPVVVELNRYYKEIGVKGISELRLEHSTSRAETFAMHLKEKEITLILLKRIEALEAEIAQLKKE